jgi:hypothetical protein
MAPGEDEVDQRRPVTSSDVEGRAGSSRPLAEHSQARRARQRQDYRDDQAK